MIKSKKVFLVTIFIFIMSSGLFSDGFSYQVDLNSRYIWRGWDLNPIHKPVIQPSLTYSIGKGGFLLNVWCSISFENKELNEIDFTLSYNFKKSENFSLSAGFVNYGWYFADNFSFKDYSTQEFYITAGLPNFILGPELSIYYDINKGDGLYAVISVRHPLNIAGKYSADLSASLGYNAGQWLPEGAATGFSDLNLGVAFPLKTGKVTVTPYATYTFVLLDAIGNENHFWFGVSIAF